LLPWSGRALIAVGALDTPGQAFDVEVEGDLAYVADGASGLRVIDVSDPALPVEVGALDTPHQAESVAVVGSLAYVADRSSGVRIIDVSDPTSMVELGALDTPGNALDVEVVGDLAYVADDQAGLRVIDVSDPALPVELGAFDTPGRAQGVEVVGDLVYVADGISGLRVLDVSDPALPIEIGSLDTPGSPRDIEVVGDLAYVTDSYSAGVRVIDVSDPTAPVELGALDSPGSAEDLELVDGLIYLADGASGLRVIDFGPEYGAGLDVEIDIRPRREPNVIYPFSRLVIPVALLGSDDFDVSEVDVITLAFGPDEAIPIFDLTNPSVYFFSHRDVNHDGVKDLLSYYRTEDTGIGLGDTQACLTGETLDGRPLAGCDGIETVPGCGHGFEAGLVLPPMLWIRGRLRRRRVSRRSQNGAGVGSREASAVGQLPMNDRNCSRLATRR
jgi:hypothetical protein